MSLGYRQDQLKIAIAKILQTLGWNSITTTPLEILTDILSSYVSQIGTTATSYANEFGCTQPNIDHLGLCFRDLNININELEEYVTYVNFGPVPKPVPKFPIIKEDNLNFLKPGSKEVVTRPVHIHEHLPPMNPLTEGTEPDSEPNVVKTEEPSGANTENSQVFKKPTDVLPAEFKRPSVRREEEGSRPTREISSVMMTTSGFLSPAREGRLPESRTPITSLPEPILTPPVSTPQEILPDTNKKVIKPIKKVERKRERTIKSSMKSDDKVKKLFATRTKQRMNIDGKLQLLSQGKSNHNVKASKALAAARLKTEKLNTTITAINVNKSNNNNNNSSNNNGDNVDKISTEPDKKKVNIFKKISNVKNEKNDVKGNNNKKYQDSREESRESSPDLIIDEPDEVVSKASHQPTNIIIEPINLLNNKNDIEKLETPYFDDDSPTGTPSTPKTPEMITHSPPLVKEKRKRKDSGKVRKIQKYLSPHRLDPEAMDIEMERPKTPEAQVLLNTELLQASSLGSIQPFPFITNFGGPGLIPSPLAMAFTSINNTHNFGQKPPFIPLLPHNLSIHSTTPPPNIPLHHPTLKSDDININSLVTDMYSQLGSDLVSSTSSPKPEKKNKEHKKEKKDKLKKRNKKDKIKDKAEKKKLKEEKREKIKKEKREKRKEKEVLNFAKLTLKFKESDNPMKITLTLKSPAVRSETSETRKLNIKPIVKKDDDVNGEERKRETSPGLAKISALVTGPPKQKANVPTTSQSAEETIQETPVTPLPRTGPGPGRPRIHPLKPQPPKPKKRRSPVKKDAEGNEVWICPACGRQDDGSPMIGCDGCDAWYHWVCVGIQVPPDENEDWYCRHCLLKKNEDLQTDKQKKKRKKREKKEH